MKFWLDCEPPTTTSQGGGKRIIVNRKTGRPMFFKDARQKAWVNTLAKLLSQVPRQGLLIEPGDPIMLHIDIVFPLLKKDTSTKKKRDDLEFCPVVWHTGKPDADNAAKAIQDALKDAGFFTDDSKVVELQVRKLRGTRPGIGIQIRSLPDAWMHQGEFRHKEIRAEGKWR